MIRERINGILLYRFEGLSEVKGLSHAILTRIGGVSQGPYATLHLGHTVGDDLSAVAERQLETLGHEDPGRPRIHSSPCAVQTVRLRLSIALPEISRLRGESKLSKSRLVFPWRLGLARGGAMAPAY